MAMGSSISPRVQSVSHLCVQTRPQTAGKGLGSLATVYASAKRPSAMRAT